MKQYILLASIGNDDRDTLIGYLTGNPRLGLHTTTAKSRTLCLYILLQGHRRLYPTYHLAPCIGRGTIVYAIYIT